MHIDPMLPIAVEIFLGILFIAILLRWLKQPHVVGYLIAGVLLGPHVLGLISDQATQERLGAIGVVLLLFFIGMEVSPKRLIARWKVAVIGTLIQICVSVGIVWLLGNWLEWPFARSVLIGFVISLSSTAVVLKMLQDWNEMDTDTGQDVLGILLFQDMAIIPMLMVIGFLSGDRPDIGNLMLQGIGGTFIITLMVIILVKDSINLPLASWLKNDHEMQVFAALIICFGLATLTGLFGLSTALGAFVGGMLVGSAQQTQWVHHSLNPLRVIFVAFFFVSIGTLLNLDFLITHWQLIGILVIAAFITNSFINALILLLSGKSWKKSLYAGVLLSQIGEFSFVLAAVGFEAALISDYGYQLTIAIIAITLILSPPWIATMRYVLKVSVPKPG